MKKIILSFLILTSLLGVQSCSEDFEVSAPYKHVTIVYSMLNVQDTAHYVRIQKAFLDENKNALDMAKESDSNFYKPGDLEVYIKELANGVPTMAPIQLTRVNMADEGYHKEPGLFFQAPNYAYKFKHGLITSRTYRLVINNKLTGLSDSAEISIVDSAKLQVLGQTTNRAINFAITDPTAQANKFILPFNPGNSKYVEAAMRFFWEEKVPGSSTSTRDTAEFVFAVISDTNLLKGNQLVVENFKFYNFLSSAMGPAPAGIGRYMDSVEIVLYGAGKEYSDYLLTTQLQNSGLTADQIKPQYTNIRGKDVFGLFSSKTTRKIRNAYLANETMDSLMKSQRTRDLNILGRADP